MYKIALTGLIGAGKSTVSECFAALGIGCYNSDSRAKYLMSSTLSTEITSLLGSNAYLENGELNRKYISDIIFSNESLRLGINRIVHPAIVNDFLKWSSLQKSPYVIIETAILKESGLLDIVDKVIVVTACEKERIHRTIIRDHSTENNVRKRISTQANESELLELADYLIDNSEDVLIIPQILEIDKIILSLCTNKKITQ